MDYYIYTLAYICKQGKSYFHFNYHSLWQLLRSVEDTSADDAVTNVRIFCLFSAFFAVCSTMSPFPFRRVIYIPSAIPARATIIKMM